MFGRTNSRPSGGGYKVETGTITLASAGTLTIPNPFNSKSKVKKVLVYPETSVSGSTVLCFQYSDIDNGYHCVSLKSNLLLSTGNTYINITVKDNEIKMANRTAYSSYTDWAATTYKWEVFGE